MLYVVSGYMRTGTSMMMRALEAGGLNACYRQSRDVIKNRHGDEHYDPNIGGLYELERKDYQKLLFPRVYDGKLIKALGMGVPSMSPMLNGISVIFMRRDAEEVRQSFNAFFSKRISYTNFDIGMEDIISKIENRKDVRSLNVFWYRDVLKSPVCYFEKLINSGWPIDLEKAVAVVNSKLCRFKHEILVEGI